MIQTDQHGHGKFAKALIAITNCNSHLKQTFSVIGIDEAGRGPLAGPVAVGAVLVMPGFDTALVAPIKNKDSKKLNHQKREIWFKKMQQWKRDGLIDFHVALVSHTIIDTKGI
ncbi:MAG: rnhB, partial [Candidatus Paceibacter sp.]|nr:rnhB [Candidatus Paceibacter sp.]